MSSLLRCVAVLIAGLCSTVSAYADGPGDDFGGYEFRDKLLQMGTGSEGGSFRPIGAALCDAVNKDRQRSLVRCVPVGTAGSSFNLQALIDGSMQLGLAQEDLAAKAVAGQVKGQGNELRAIAVMHSTPIAVMVRRSSGINQLSDLAGKAVNMGNRGSGQFEVASAILRALGIRAVDLGKVTYAPTSDFEKLFCTGQVDVVFEAVGHPVELFRRLRTCGGEFVDIPEDVQARMMADNPFLFPMQIPPETYAGQSTAVKTVGMRNILLSSSAVSEEAVFRFTSVLLKRFADAQSEAAALHDVPSPGHVERLPLSLHPGSERAYGRNARAYGIDAR